MIIKKKKKTAAKTQNYLGCLTSVLLVLALGMVLNQKQMADVGSSLEDRTSPLWDLGSAASF